jgi:hypothetical protein
MFINLVKCPRLCNRWFLFSNKYLAAAVLSNFLDTIWQYNLFYVRGGLLGKQRKLQKHTSIYVIVMQTTYYICSSAYH